MEATPFFAVVANIKEALNQWQRFDSELNFRHQCAAESFIASLIAKC